MKTLLLVPLIFCSCSSDDDPAYTTLEDLTRHGACEVISNGASKCAFDYSVDDNTPEYTAMICGSSEHPTTYVWSNNRLKEEYRPDGTLSKQWKHDEQGRTIQELVYITTQDVIKTEFSYPTPDVITGQVYTEEGDLFLEQITNLTRNDFGDIEKVEKTLNEPDSEMIEFFSRTLYSYEDGRLIAQQISQSEGDSFVLEYKYECNWKSFPPDL